MIKAVLFDMDGVLYDSMPAHIRAWSEVATRHNLVHDPHNFYLWEGRTGDSTINILFQDTYGHDASPEQVKALYAEKAELFNQYNDGRIMSGVREVLELTRSLGLDMLIVTGSGQHSLIDRLEANFPGFFTKEKMVTSFDVLIGKPHPEPYLMGLRKAGVRASEAIVVENAPLGVQSAKAAGIFTIAVNTGPLPDEVLLDAGADRLFRSMAELAAELPALAGSLHSL
ncbi:MAG: HAD-IA family hydrolase [Tannerellaceae bacterium]|jgi:HAD superfamily hydrolase (TIGR01509 family)|nr:HAD-IA family hydrolase [Tannerellaceae bacterium]